LASRCILIQNKKNEEEDSYPVGGRLYNPGCTSTSCCTCEVGSPPLLVQRSSSSTPGEGSAVGDVDMVMENEVLAEPPPGKADG
jgi:hypothetical protein